MEETISLSEFGIKEINRRVGLGHKTITRGNFNISLEKLLAGDENAIGLLRGPLGDSCIYTTTTPVETKKRSRKKGNPTDF
jgi:hypothetical protein